MRWLRIRQAELPQQYRDKFEELGSEIVRAYLTQGPGFVVWTQDGSPTTVAMARPYMQCWLREQYDRAERKETWSLAMEVAITVLVLSELVISIATFLHTR